MRCRWLAFLFLLTFTQSYVWTRKKKDKHAVPAVTRRRVEATTSTSTSTTEGPAALKVNSAGEDGSTTLEVFENGVWHGGLTVTLSAEECMRTVDLGEMVCPKLGLKDNCSLFSAVGTRVISCSDLRIDNSVFVVPEGRPFMLPTRGVGYVATIDHIIGASAVPIRAETLSESPRIFRLQNFVSLEEAGALVANARARWARAAASGGEGSGSPAGEAPDAMDPFSSPGQPQDPFRTADLAFDLSSTVALALKRRLFDLLGIFPYDEALTDGFQTLRYNASGAYIAHLDWVKGPGATAVGAAVPDGAVKDDGSDKGKKSTKGGKKSKASKGKKGSDATGAEALAASGGAHNYDSANSGTNRYATLLVFLNDVPEGGETVFTALPAAGKALPSSTGGGKSGALAAADALSGKSGAAKDGVVSGAVEDASQAALDAQQRESAADAYLQKHNASHLVPRGSWEYEMLGYCRTRLAAKPARAEALLFYSQHPDGRPDLLSTHGGCPVIKGEKWVANLWVWNGPRNGYKGSRTSGTGVSASFESVDIDDAQLYWEDQLWDTLSPGRAVKVNTFSGHKWSVRVEGEEAFSWTIQEGRPSQRFVISADAMPL